MMRVGVSFFDVIDKPAQSVLESLLGFSGAGSDGPLPPIQNLCSELLQNLNGADNT